MRRVTVAGIPGIHTVLETATALDPPHEMVKIRLAPGTVYGRYQGGDTIAIEAWRVHDVPATGEEA